MLLRCWTHCGCLWVWDTPCHLSAQHLRCIIIKNWGDPSGHFGGTQPWPLGDRRPWLDRPSADVVGRHLSSSAVELFLSFFSLFKTGPELSAAATRLTVKCIPQVRPCAELHFSLRNLAHPAPNFYIGQKGRNQPRVVLFRWNLILSLNTYVTLDVLYKRLRSKERSNSRSQRDVSL